MKKLRKKEKKERDEGCEEGLCIEGMRVRVLMEKE